MDGDGLAEVGGDEASLLPAGFDDGEHGFDEAASASAVRAEGELAPNDAVSQGAFADVDRGLDSRAIHESPEPRAMDV